MTLMKCVMFPGQGSQKPGMGKDLYDGNSAAAETFNRVALATGIDIQTLCFDTPEDDLRQTQNAQIALYTTGLAAYRALEAEGVQISTFAGHSIGEYAALAAAGIVTIEEGSLLVQTRGELMASSGVDHPGTMAAVLGLDADVIQETLSQLDGIVVIANDNCPGQVVISGEVEAVKAAGPLLQAAGAKRVLPLNVSGAFHSPLMIEASKSMATALSKASFVSGKTVYSNVTANSVENPTEWAGLLERQLSGTVRWTETVQNLIASGVDTFIECGSGEVLSGLVKRTSNEVTTLSVQDLDSLGSVAQALK